MVEGAGLCCEDDCTSVMHSGLVWVVTVQVNYRALRSLHVNALCPAKYGNVPFVAGFSDWQLGEDSLVPFQRLIQTLENCHVLKVETPRFFVGRI